MAVIGIFLNFVDNFQQKFALIYKYVINEHRQAVTQDRPRGKGRKGQTYRTKVEYGTLRIHTKHKHKHEVWMHDKLDN